MSIYLWNIIGNLDYVDIKKLMSRTSWYLQLQIDLQSSITNWLLLWFIQ